MRKPRRPKWIRLPFVTSVDIDRSMVTRDLALFDLSATVARVRPYLDDGTLLQLDRDAVANDSHNVVADSDEVAAAMLAEKALEAEAE